VHKLMRSPLWARLSSSFLGALIIVALLFAFEQPAQAYVDPGSGFVFLQVAGSMAVGALFYLRHRIRKLFGFMHKSEQPVPSADSAETPS
jgi:hypothetical protein